MTHIFNCCISTGVFPDILKKALIHPIYKSGVRDRVINYRPISILPSLSKILERIMNSRLKKYIESIHLLSDCQYGFRNGRSTDDAVHELTNHIVNALDNRKKCLAIFLDLAKAFDTVSIPNLVSKLEAIGLRGNQLKLFESYLHNRTQCVKIGDHISSELQIEYGVPQGSILGPTLFLIYINELCKTNLQNGKLIAFADDTTLIFTGNNWKETFAYAQTGFNIITEWLSNNTLSLNTDKTKYLTFFIKNQSNTSLTNYNLYAHNHHISGNNYNCLCPKLLKTDQIKYLGINIDEKLCFIPHIKVLSNRVRKLIFVFKHLRHVADPNVIKMVYYALCQSILGYCISSWGGACKSYLEQLEIAQRAVLKICTFKPFLFPTEELYKYCEVLTVRQLFILSIIIKQHKIDPNSLDDQQRSKRLNIIPRTNTCNTIFSQRFHYFLGCFLYNKANKILCLQTKSVYECKKVVSDWLLKLNYCETENLLQPVR